MIIGVVRICPNPRSCRETGGVRIDSLKPGELEVAGCERGLGAGRTIVGYSWIQRIKTSQQAQRGRAEPVERLTLAAFGSTYLGDCSTHELS